MAAMSVIGIDFGNESCYVAVAKAGGIETIANDYSLRATPSCMAFSGKNRILGVAAKNQQITNMKNTVYGIKRLLGRKFRDPRVQNELKQLSYTAVETSGGNIGVRVNYMQEEHVFSPEQCLAMLLTKLKETSEVALQTQVNDCVISVPSYFTNNERKALLDAAAIAGLNVLRLFNETTATALAYGIYKQDLPAAEEKPRNVVFVDFGQSSLQAAVCAFHKGKLRMLASAADPDLGSRDIDLILAEHFCKEFQTNYRIDARTNPRAFVRLLAEVERLKKQMSANSTTLPLGIECFMDDKDVKSEIKRVDMEAMCLHLFKRVERTLLRCLDQSGLQLEEIHSVEIVGGSSRIPAVKQLIEKVFNKTPSTTLNQDEAVSRGCALQCAMLSPAVRVREFNVTDVQNYPISVNWDASNDGEGQGEIEVFPANHAVPFSKMLTFYRKEPFSLRASYTADIPYPDHKIGQWIVKDIRPTTEGEAQKVKVKVRVNLHGIMTVSSASMYERKDASDMMEEEPPSASENANEAAPPNAQQPQQTQEGQNPAEDSKESDSDKKKKKQSVKSIDLPIEPLSFGYSQTEINSYTEQELKMIAADRQEKERADARNALEEYVYELRGKLSSEDELATFIVDVERESIVRQLDDMENWLYEDGEDCNRQVYQDKLIGLKTLGEPIQTRRIEFDVRPTTIDDFARSLQLGRKALEQCKANDPKYAHLTEEDVNKVDQAVGHSFRWLEDARSKLVSAPRHLPPPITVAQLRQEKQSFEQIVSPILNKQPPPKPQPAAPPKDEKNGEANPTTGEQQNQPQQQDEQNNSQQQQPPNSQGDKMEWS